MNMLDPQTLYKAEAELNIEAAFIEKDWFIARLLSSLASWSVPEVTLIFTGGTSLSKAHRIIYRFSEDIDVRLKTDQLLSRKDRSRVRESLLTHLRDAGWILEDVRSRNESQFIGMAILYSSVLPASSLRPFLKLDVIFNNPRRPLVTYPVSSLMADLTQSTPEVPSILCLAVEEIAAEKLSALCWRLQDEKQPDRRDLVRHLHDLACLSPKLSVDEGGFRELVMETLEADLAGRTDATKEQAAERIRLLPMVLAAYGPAYREYVGLMSYGQNDQAPPSFEAALEAMEALTKHLSG